MASDISSWAATGRPASQGKQRAKKQKELKNLFRRDCGIERLPNKPQDSDVLLCEQEAFPCSRLVYHS
jgi:hypothetical protein